MILDTNALSEFAENNPGVVTASGSTAAWAAKAHPAGSVPCTLQERTGYSEIAEVFAQRSVFEERWFNLSIELFDLSKNLGPLRHMATEGKISGETQKRYSRLVDMWAAPGLNPTNIDIVTKLKSAEDRQFSKNMSITGKIFDKDSEAKTDEETHLIGIRTDIWKPSKEDCERSLNAIKKKRKQELKEEVKANGRLTKSEKTQLEAKVEADETMSMSGKNVDKARLVLKLFRSTGKNINWKGSLEELTVREVHQSIGSKKALITFAVNLPGYEYLIHIQQCRRFFRPAVFSFAYLNDKTDEMWYIDVKKYWFSLGIDYHVEAQGQRIGKIDGKLLALGTDSIIKIKEPALAQDQKFIDLLTLFSASIGFHRTIWKNIRKRVKNIQNGNSVHVIEDEELWLLKNPRRVMR